MLFPWLNDRAVFSQIGQNSVNSFFIDNPHSFSGNSKPHPTIFTLNPKSVMLQIGQEAALGFVIGV
jgi:hypothetical protein